jgi:hypothetical protein
MEMHIQEAVVGVLEEVLVTHHPIIAHRRRRNVGVIVIMVLLMPLHYPQDLQVKLSTNIEVVIRL